MSEQPTTEGISIHARFGRLYSDGAYSEEPSWWVPHVEYERLRQHWEEACKQIGTEREVLRQDNEHHVARAYAAEAAVRLAPEPRDELGWLIERNDGTQPQWLRVMDRSFVWVIDASTALRFARKTDAENFMRLHPEKTVVAQAVEHMWCPRSPETKAGAE